MQIPPADFDIPILGQLSRTELPFGEFDRDPLLLTGRGITLGSISVGSRTDFEAMNRAIEMHRFAPRD